MLAVAAGARVRTLSLWVSFVEGMHKHLSLLVRNKREICCKDYSRGHYWREHRN